MKRPLLYVLIAVISFISCEKLILDDQLPNTPENNLRLFWLEIANHSSLIDVKNIDWLAAYNRYRPLVNDNTSDEELWNIMSEMIELFDDEHTVLFDDKENAYVSGSSRIQDAVNSFSKDLVREKYLDYYIEFDPQTLAEDFSFGKIKDRNIGYIYIGDSDSNNPRALMDSIINSIGIHDAIIIDIRNNGGGLGEFAKIASNKFASDRFFLYTTQEKIGPGLNDYDKPFDTYTVPADGNYVKPAIVLTDARTVSAAEAITISLKTNPQIIQIGDTTAGAFSTIANRQFLLNGWSFRYPIEKSNLMDGTPLDGDGLVPDIYIKNTPEDIMNQNDKVLEGAMQYLFDTFGID